MAHAPRPRVAVVVAVVAGIGAVATGAAAARPARDAGFVTDVKALARAAPGSGWTTAPILSGS